MEFPKHLYLNGDRSSSDKVVNNSTDESAARADGYRMLGEPEPVKDAVAEKKKK